MQQPKRVVLVRHGQSEGNVKSSEDVSCVDKANHEFALTKKGREQVLRTSKYLREKFGKFDTYFVSSFARTQETMRLLYPEAKPMMDVRLNEHWRGIWHSMKKENVAESYRHENAIQTREGWYHYRPPGGHSCPDVEVYIHSWLQTLQLAHAGETLLVAGHGKWMILLWRVLQNKTPQEAEERYRTNKYANASITVYEGAENHLVLTEDNILP